MIPRLTSQHRGDHFLARGAPQEEPEDQDLDVVKMGEPGDEEVPFRFSLPWGQMTPVPGEDVASRHVWLGLTALYKKDREDLLGAPVSTEGLFGSISSVTQRFSHLEEERVQLSRMLPLAPPQAPQRAPPRVSLQARERSVTAKRREAPFCVRGFISPSPF